MKDLIRSTFQLTMATTSLTANELPMWPSVDPGHPDWPKSSNGNREAVRFRWDKTFKHADNAKGINLITNLIQQHGHLYSVSAAPALRLIAPADLRERVIQKFKDLMKVLRIAGKIPKSTRQTAAAVQVGGDGDDGDAVVVLTKSQRQSQATGVSISLLD